MSPDHRELEKPLAWGYDGFLIRQVPFAAGLALFGLVPLLLMSGDGPRDGEALVAGVILIIAGLGYIAYAFYLKAHPREPVFRISPTGIRYRLSAVKDVLIPWREVQGVDSIDFGLWPHRFRDVTVLLVSKAFYDAKIDVRSIWRQGPGWHRHFIAKGKQVQIALHHDLLSMPADEVRSAIEARWRAFSSHPNAKLPAVARAPRVPGVLERLAPSRAVKRALLVALVLLALPAAYYWQWGWAWMSFSVPEGSRSYYLEQLLAGRGVPARHADGRMSFVRSDEVVEDSPPDCVREIVRAASQTSFTPSYTASATCTTVLTLKSGGNALGIFRLVVVDASWEDYSGKRHPGSAIATAPMTLEEADAKLCAMGECGPGGARHPL